MFYAPWCGFCRKAMPAVAAFQKANHGVPVLRIDCDANRDVAREWGVQAFPTFQVIWRDKQAVQVGGGITAVDVQRLYQQALSALR
jgi:thiol-disulfide isomerase/thioredoxin